MLLCLTSPVEPAAFNLDTMPSPESRNSGEKNPVLSHWAGAAFFPGSRNPGEQIMHIKLQTTAQAVQRTNSVLYCKDHLQFKEQTASDPCTLWVADSANQCFQMELFGGDGMEDNAEKGISTEGVICLCGSGNTRINFPYEQSVDFLLCG